MITIIFKADRIDDLKSDLVKLLAITNAASGEADLDVNYLAKVAGFARTTHATGSGVMCGSQPVSDNKPDKLDAETVDNPVVNPTDPADEPQPTMEEARAALNEYRKKKGLPALKALFAAHGVKNFLELPATEYAAIMKEAKADV